MRTMKASVVLLCLLTGAAWAQKEEPEEKEVLLPQGKVTVAIDPGTSVAPLRRVYWLPDGKHLVTAGKDNAVRLWDAETLKVVKTVQLPGFGLSQSKNQSTDAALSPDGKRLAVGGRHVGKDGKADNVVFLLSMPDGNLERTLHGHPAEATTLAFAPDGKRLAVASRYNTEEKDAGRVFLWDLTGRGRPTALRASPTGDLAFSPDGKSLAFATSVGGIRSLETSKVTRTTSGYANAYSRDGKSLYVGYGGFSVVDGAGKTVHTEKCATVRSLTVSPDGKVVLINGSRLYDVESKKIRELVEGKSLLLFYAIQGDFSPDGKHVATVGSGDGGNYLLVQETATGKIERAREWKPWFTMTNLHSTNWGEDGRSFGWENPRSEKNQSKGYGTFRLDTLEVGASAKIPYQSADQERKRGTLEFEIDKGKMGQVVEGGKRLATFGGGGSAVLVSKDRMASYNHNTIRTHINLFDARTGKALESVPIRRSVLRYLHASPDGRYLLTGHRDQTLTVMSVDPLAPLLNFYKKGNDWIVWTAEGYYAATPGGERMLSWKVDNGPDKLPSVYAADRFRKKFHRPDVIKKAFELGSVQKALEALDGKDAKAEKIEDLLPPSCEVRVLKQAGDSVTLKVSAKAQVKGQPVTALRLMLDGLPFPGLDAKRYDKPLAEAEWTLTVKVPPGKHTLSALVRSEDASARADAVGVEYQAKEDRPTLHVLAVGIDDYAGGIPKLTCAVNDAKDLTKAFASAKKGELFKDVVTHEPLTDKAATSKAVRDKLTALRKVVNREDVVVVFFAGHGTLSKGDFYFLTHDSASAKLGDDNAISGKKLAEALGGLGCRVLLLLDACHSGAADLKPASDDAARNLSDDDAGVTVLSAAQGRQKAREKDGNGLFTLALKEALSDTSKKPAPRDSQGRMFVYHLFAHVSERVGEMSNFEQSPFLRLPDGVPPFALRQFDKK